MRLDKFHVMKHMAINRIETQSELAGKIGVARASLSNWLNGVTFPDSDNMAILCDVLKCTPNDIIDLSLSAPKGTALATQIPPMALPSQMAALA